MRLRAFAKADGRERQRLAGNSHSPSRQSTSPAVELSPRCRYIVQGLAFRFEQNEPLEKGLGRYRCAGDFNAGNAPMDLRVQLSTRELGDLRSTVGDTGT